ncbi:hypothetical protein [Streptomyces sp. NPDC005423]|uniref:hypothetical protein n=1 Tax=Streptomyces sp. NPDC005423 TaxID=3155343 RepID=UPI0033AC42B3
MEREPAGLVATAASALVDALAGDDWERARALVGRLWGHHEPHRRSDTDREVARDRAMLLIEPDDEANIADLTAAWRVRFRRLLAAEPAAARALLGLLAELTAGDGSSDARTAQHVNLGAAGRGRVPIPVVHRANGDITRLRYR